MSIWLRKFLIVSGGLLLIGGLLTSCGGGDEEGAKPTEEDVGPGATTISVVMEETEEAWSFTLDQSEVPAGEVTFEVSNKGKFEHELMVYPAQDLSHLLDEMVEAAETDEEGAHVEEEEEEAHGEMIEGLIISLAGEDELVLEPDESGSFTANLTPGTYELGCLIVETVGGETFTHHEKGMHATLTVS